MFDTVFEKCVIASGLVAETELQSAVKQMTDEGLTLTDETSEHLAQILVKRGFLNRWQSRQLLAGRGRFNLGEYRIFDSIGHGGMGQVFKARHHITKKVVAVKVLPKEKALRSQSAIDNFHREVQSLARLNHPNIVSAIDAGMDGNVYYLVVEYVPGPDLRKLIRNRGPLTEVTASNLMIQAAKGLSCAHRMGLVHRDIKPGNILVTMNGLAKLSDLGLASSQESAESLPSKVVGTADYLCPDQVRKPNEPEPIWDIYSLGCTLYFMVTGKVPYPNGNTNEKVRQHLDPNTHPVNPAFHNPGLSENFVNVLACMMAKDPRERISSADEVIRLMSLWDDGILKPLEFLNPDVNLFSEPQHYDADLETAGSESENDSGSGAEVGDLGAYSESQLEKRAMSSEIKNGNRMVSPNSPYAQICSIPAPPPVPTSGSGRMHGSPPPVSRQQEGGMKTSGNGKGEQKASKNWGGFLKRITRKSENG